MSRSFSWKAWIIRLVLLAWGLQVLWLMWYFAPDVREMAWRVTQGQVGREVRREDPLYRWVQTLAAAMPADATYLFLDDYQAGKEIEARYHLTPRRHILLVPDIPTSFLFFAARQEEASYLIIRGETPLGPGTRAALEGPAFSQINIPGPGLVFRVDNSRLLGEFYD